MPKLSTDLTNRTLHPRETIFATGTLGALNAEISIAADGCNTVSIDLRGTFNLTVEIAGTVDGTNWTLIPVRQVNVAAVGHVAAIAGSTAGIFTGDCSPFRQVRARVTAYTSGAATACLSADQGLAGPFFAPTAARIETAVGAASASVTLTLPAPGAGLRQYLTWLSIDRFASALLTAAATPVTVTTTNLPGSLAFSFAADTAAQGTLDRFHEEYAFPVAASAQNTSVTIVCPATTGVIWRATAGYFVAP
jgi:hypothetical protein